MNGTLCQCQSHVAFVNLCAAPHTGRHWLQSQILSIIGPCSAKQASTAHESIPFKGRTRSSSAGTIDQLILSRSSFCTFSVLFKSAGHLGFHPPKTNSEQAACVLCESHPTASAANPFRGGILGNPRVCCLNQ